MKSEQSEVILNHLKDHRSIRKYSNRAVPESLLTEILEAGTRASSSGNMQAYSIIVTKDQSLKQRLYDLHFCQSMVLEAPVLVTFCADFHRMRRWLELSDAPENFDNYMSFMIASIDATLASQNVAIAAEAHGLGICYMGTTLANCQAIGEVLKLPQNVVPVVGFSLGYPDEYVEKRDRLPLNAIVHEDVYQDPTDAEILHTYEKKETSGMKRYTEVPELKERIEAVGAKNLAQVYTKAKYTRESHHLYSQTVLGYLHRQNFMRNH